MPQSVLFPTWNLGEFLEFANLGLNVNRKDLDCEVQNLETKSVLGTCANFVAESTNLLGTNRSVMCFFQLIWMFGVWRSRNVSIVRVLQLCTVCAQT